MEKLYINKTLKSYLEIITKNTDKLLLKVLESNIKLDIIWGSAIKKERALWLTPFVWRTKVIYDYTTQRDIWLWKLSHTELASLIYLSSWVTAWFVYIYGTYMATQGIDIYNTMHILGAKWYSIWSYLFSTVHQVKKIKKSLSPDEYESKNEEVKALARQQLDDLKNQCTYKHIYKSIQDTRKYIY